MGRLFGPDRIAQSPSNPLNVSKADSELPSAAEAASIRKSGKPTLRKIVLNSFFKHWCNSLCQGRQRQFTLTSLPHSNPAAVTSDLRIACI